MRVTFFAHKSLEAIRRIGFYSRDIQILEELGHEVRVANSIPGLLAGTDLYFIWWWTGAFLPVAVARLRRVPTIITGVFNYNLSDLPQTDYVRRPWWHKRLIAWSMRNARANIFVSEYEHDVVTTHLSVPNARVIPLVVDTNLYLPPSSMPRDSRLILNVAWSESHSARRKCLFEIVESIPIVTSAVPDARYVFCGAPGDVFDALRSRVRELGVDSHVEFRGYVSESDKIALMRSCAVYLSPSRYEGFGLAIAEAMSCGAPVISSPVGSVPEVVGAHGVLVDGTSAAAIAAATTRLLRDSEYRAQLGSAARDHIRRHFGYENRRDALASILASLVPSSRVVVSGEISRQQPSTRSPS
jgi:glycosyltransferase involved in cell wall biosynthesis